LARAAKRTLGKFVFDFIRTNPTIYDSVAFFHNDHANLGSAALDYEIEYLQPMRAGQAVEMRSGLLDAGDKVYHVFHYLVDSSTGEVITSIVVAALFFDLAARKAVAIPDAVRGEMARLIGGAAPG